MPQPTASALKEAHQEAMVWLRRPYVAGIAIGQTERGGQMLSTVPAIVVTIDHKMDPGSVQSLRRRPFPKFISVRDGGRAHRVPVDVQETGGDLVGTLHGLVTKSLIANGSRRGAVGAVLQDANGPWILTAGHVVRDVGATVTVGAGTGAVQGSTEWVSPPGNPRLDHGLISPVTPLSPEPNRISGFGVMTKIRVMRQSILGAAVFVHPAAGGAAIQTEVRRIEDTARFYFPEGIRRLYGLIAVDQVSVPGDSGTLLHDSSARGLGTLVGALGRWSFFAPLEELFTTLEVQLA